MTVALVSVLLAGAPSQAAGDRAAAAATASARACSSYPTPGSIAPAGTPLPAGLGSRYAILRRPQRRGDRLKTSEIDTSLSASGLIPSATRFLGSSAVGGRIYLVVARHLLGYRLAPPRCIPADQRSLEQELRPELEREYRHAAVCIVVLRADTESPSCAAASRSPDALLYAIGTPGFGLVPDGVGTVAVTYQTAPPRIVPVRRNFFLIDDPRQTAAPCGVQWLDPTGSVRKVVTGCSYVSAESQELQIYRTYVAGELSALQTQAAALASAIASGDLAQAKSDWLTAHLTWLDIGQDDGAYGCFGNLGGEIDGLAAGHPLGTSDPGFTGFHRIEYELWTAGDMAAAASQTATLQRLLTELVQTPLATYLPATPTGLGGWVLRPHEVLEDALRDSLTADDDYGSGTDLASVSADVAAVRELLGVLEPTLDPLAPHLARRARGELGALSSAIAATQVNGAWVSIENLPTRQRQQIDADVDAALETLAPVPDLLTSTGRNSPIT
jgi:iron uptake system EfeUOB component EfeO/EfeM